MTHCGPEERESRKLLSWRGLSDWWVVAGDRARNGVFREVREIRYAAASDGGSKHSIWCETGSAKIHHRLAWRTSGGSRAGNHTRNANPRRPTIANAATHISGTIMPTQRRWEVGALGKSAPLGSPRCWEVGAQESSRRWIAGRFDGPWETLTRCVVASDPPDAPMQDPT
jgi:hypothetical protein